MKLTRKVGAIALIVTMTLPIMACDRTSPAQQNPSEVELEDCDAEDWRNYEAECNRWSPKPSKPAIKKTPKPKTTRR